MLLIETSREYGRRLVEGIGAYVAACGPWSLSFHERGLDDPLPPWIEEWKGDGIISRTVRQADIDRLLGTRLPVVELFADPALGLPRVYSDTKSVARLAVEHFTDRGLAQVAYFAPWREWWSDSRGAAFLELAQQRGLSGAAFTPIGSSPANKPGSTGAARRLVQGPEEQWFARPRGGTHDADGNRRSGKRRDGSVGQQIADWVWDLPKPCGVFCASDSYALDLINVCRKVGIAIPEQIAVLGVDNDLVISTITDPPLSSISLNASRIGYEAAALLDRMMAGQPAPREGLAVEPEGVVARRSTDILLISDPDVAHALRIIREQAFRGLQVADLAQAVAISRRTLEKRFQASLQRSPKEEILRVQMDRAKQLLRQTSLPIEHVARKSGFPSFRYFARVFRREEGVTPRSYRQMQRVPCYGDATG